MAGQRCASQVIRTAVRCSTLIGRPRRNVRRCHVVPRRFGDAPILGPRSSADAGPVSCTRRLLELLSHSCRTRFRGSGRRSSVDSACGVTGDVEDGAGHAAASVTANIRSIRSWADACPVHSPHLFGGRSHLSFHSSISRRISSKSTSLASGTIKSNSRRSWQTSGFRTRSDHATSPILASTDM